jgi:leucyl/phenylalanyl-tRNA---protein transferase
MVDKPEGPGPGAGPGRGRGADGRTALGIRRVPRRGDPDGVAPAPTPVPPSAWELPDAATADEDGIVGVGADLHPATLVDAYRRGIFPWPHTGVPLPWFSPDPRGVLDLGAFRVHRSLLRTLRRSGWVTTVDRAPEAVLEGCATGRGAEGTWISPPMRRAYLRLHSLGWVHSVEVWDGADLVGGLYGVQVGGVFTGESMFHRASGASKVALLDLADRFAAAGGRLIDVQVTTPHLASLGVVDVPRASFLRSLAAVVDDDVRLARGVRAVVDLADRPPCDQDT